MLNKLLQHSHPLTAVRRNHALEHATLRILSLKHPRLNLAGYSDFRGFWVYGSLSTDALQEAVDEALSRLKAGEYSLAIHPTCGTNFVVSGMIAGSAAWLGMLGTRNVKSNLERWPLVVVLTTLALIFSNPLGPKLQRVLTTEPRLGDLRVFEIIRLQRNRTPIHRVVTQCRPRSGEQQA
jgi:hypothetical protein